MGKSLFDVLD